MENQLNPRRNKNDLFCMAGSYTSDKERPKIPIEEKRTT